MRAYLKSISGQLRNFSQSLDKTAILIEKPWAMIDGENEMQKLIFKKDKELVLSRNGKVTMGSWDYFPEARSILINRGTDSILCNEAFVNESVMILKMDGTQDHFFALANENRIPDLDVFGYLSRLKEASLNIRKFKLNDGNMLEISFVSHNVRIDYLKPGLRVFQGGEPAKEGKYFFPDLAIQVAGGQISMMMDRAFYTTRCGQTLELHIPYNLQGNKPSEALINGKPAPDGIYKIGWLKKVRVKGGVVV